MNICLVKNLS